MTAISRARAGLVAGLGLYAFATAAFAATAAPAAAPAGPPPEWLRAQVPGTRVQESGGMINTYPPNVPPQVRSGVHVPQISTIDILAVDFEKSVDYYEKVLGMVVYMRRGTDSFRSAFLAWPTPDGKALGHPGIRIMRDVNYVHNQRLPHMIVASDDVQGLVKKSEAYGIPVPRNRGTMAFLTDPSGNFIEVVTYRPIGAPAPPTTPPPAR